MKKKLGLRLTEVLRKMKGREREKRQLRVFFFSFFSFSLISILSLFVYLFLFLFNYRKYPKILIINLNHRYISLVLNRIYLYFVCALKLPKRRREKLKKYYDDGYLDGNH